MDPTFSNAAFTVAGAIAALQETELRTADVAQISKQLGLISRGWLTNAYTFRARPDSILVRARICDQLPEHLSEIGPPSPEKISGFGRANFPRQSVFYASAGRSMPFFEIGARVGNRVALSVWEIAKPLTVLPVGYVEEVFRRHGSKREPLPQFATAVQTPEQRLVHSFLNEQFCRVVDPGNTHEYKLSATFAQMVYRSKQLHGILYPSLATSANGDNVALRRDVLSQGIVKLRWIEWIEIIGIECKQYTVRTLMHAERFVRGRIYWDEIRSVTLGPGEQMRVSVRNGRHRFEVVDKSTNNLSDITPVGFASAQ